MHLLFFSYTFCTFILHYVYFFFFFFFNDTATTEIYTLSLHDALPICSSFYKRRNTMGSENDRSFGNLVQDTCTIRDRKSTRLNSSHSQISYAVFCLKKKKKIILVK